MLYSHFICSLWTRIKDWPRLFIAFCKLLFTVDLLLLDYIICLNVYFLTRSIRFNHFSALLEQFHIDDETCRSDAHRQCIAKKRTKRNIDSCILSEIIYRLISNTESWEKMIIVLLINLNAWMFLEYILDSQRRLWYYPVNTTLSWFIDVLKLVCSAAIMLFNDSALLIKPYMISLRIHGIFLFVLLSEMN